MVKAKDPCEDIGCNFFVFSGLVMDLTSILNSNLSTPPLPNELAIVGPFAGVLLHVTLIYILSLEMNQKRIQCPAH